MNRYARNDDDPPDGVSWRLWPKRRGGKLTRAEVMQELFDQGMAGNLYVQLIRIPGEFPAEPAECVDLYEPEEAVRLLCGWCNLKGRLTGGFDCVIWDTESKKMKKTEENGQQAASVELKPIADSVFIRHYRTESGEFRHVYKTPRTPYLMWEGLSPETGKWTLGGCVCDYGIPLTPKTRAEAETMADCFARQRGWTRYEKGGESQ